MLREALSKSGYDQEEFYFHEENRRLVEEIKKDPLKIRRALRDMSLKSANKAEKSIGASKDSGTAPKKVA